VGEQRKKTTPVPQKMNLGNQKRWIANIQRYRDTKRTEVKILPKRGENRQEKRRRSGLLLSCRSSFSLVDGSGCIPSDKRSGGFAVADPEQASQSIRLLIRKNNLRPPPDFAPPYRNIAIQLIQFDAI
jgi:hypothetical protein